MSFEVTPAKDPPRFLSKRPRIRISDLQQAKKEGEKWVMLTSYDATSARIFDHAGIPCVLIGDSAAQSVYGYSSTLPITMDELIPLARAVSRSCKRSMVIGDMPFGSYQESPAVALRNATRFMKESQVHGVKLEGGEQYFEHVRLLTQAGIPVMAHVGFTPQSEHQLSGFKVQGRGEKALEKILRDAYTLEKAGAFACVLELVPSEVGRAVTQSLSIPTIGIGAGPDCDAQVLVWNDIAGFTAPKGGGGYLRDVESDGQPSNSNAKPLELEKVPKFVKRYCNLTEILHKAVIDLSEDVRNGVYPSEEHCYH